MNGNDSSDDDGTDGVGAMRVKENGTHSTRIYRELGRRGKLKRHTMILEADPSESVH